MPGEKSGAKKRISKKKGMKNGSIGELGCYRIRRCNSISDRLVYLRSVGCGDISYHCDDSDGDYQILVRG
jgi:hypothetical protein